MDAAQSSLRHAPLETVKLAHDRDYVDQFVNGTLPPNVMRRIGFPWSEGLVQRTLASAGGTLAATRDALETGFGGTLAGGTHHAFRSEGSGFCVFNDVAIAIHSFRKRAAVIDLDVHQGDGTAHFFEHDPNVLTISLHGANNFPFRKQRSKIDIELPDKTGDEEYLDTLDAVLPRRPRLRPRDRLLPLRRRRSLASDVLGRLSLTPEGMRKERDRRVIGMCFRNKSPARNHHLRAAALLRNQLS